MTNKIIIEIRAERAATKPPSSPRSGQDVPEIRPKRGWKFAVLDYNQTTLEGYKTLIAKIEGENCYDDLKQGIGRSPRPARSENGKSGRVHTSTASVVIFPEVEAKET